MKNKLPGSGSRPRRIWAGMKGRCKNKELRNYGAKGITYDPKWKTFAGFWEDMQKGYADNLSIDRIDSNGNYCKSNCRWATAKQQMANFAGNVHLTFNGKTMIMQDWARELGISHQALLVRIRIHGDDLKHILYRGKNKPKKKDYLKSEKWLAIRDELRKGRTQTSIAKEFGVDQTTISVALKRLHL